MIDRRSLFGLMFAAPLAASAAAKSAFAGKYVAGTTVSTLKLDASELSAFSAEMGNVIYGTLRSANGDVVIDLANGMMTVNADDTAADNDNYWNELEDIYEGCDDDFEFDYEYEVAA